MSRWAALESSWKSAKEVAACTSVAARTAATRGTRRPGRRPLRTSSTRYFADAGRTRPEKRLTSMMRRPRSRRPRRGRTMAQIWGHALLKRRAGASLIEGTTRRIGSSFQPGRPHYSSRAQLAADLPGGPRGGAHLHEGLAAQEGVDGLREREDARVRLGAQVIARQHA